MSRRRSAAGCAVAVVVLAGCTGGDAAAPAPAGPVPATPGPDVSTPITAPASGPQPAPSTGGGTVAPAPSVDPLTLPGAYDVPETTLGSDPFTGVGQVVTITDDSVQPLGLIAVVGNPLIWRNATAEPQTVVLDNAEGSSGPIPPGGTWSYTPLGTVSIVYHVERDTQTQGQVQVEPYLEPGEEPG